MLMVILMITVSFIMGLPDLSILTFFILSIRKSDTSQKRNREWIIEMVFGRRGVFDPFLLIELEKYLRHRYRLV